MDRMAMIAYLSSRENRRAARRMLALMLAAGPCGAEASTPREVRQTRCFPRLAKGTLPLPPVPSRSLPGDDVPDNRLDSAVDPLADEPPYLGGLTVVPAGSADGGARPEVIVPIDMDMDEVRDRPAPKTTPGFRLRLHLEVEIESSPPPRRD